MLGNKKKCPFCAEGIQKEAIVCRYCGRDVPIVEQSDTPPLAFTFPTDIWFYIENAVAWAPIGFVLFFSVVAFQAMKHLFVRKPPFIIDPFLPCGHLILLLIVFAVLLAKFFYRFGKNKSDGTRLVMTALIIIFVTIPSFILLVVMPALFEVLRNSALESVTG